VSFNISEFKSRIDKYGGLARKNLFVVDITFNGRNTNITVPNFSQSDLRFFCQSAILPGLNIQVQDYKPNGFGLPYSVPISLVPDQINLIFMLDSQHRVLNFFHQWMQKIINYDVSRGIFSQVNGQLPYEIGYKTDYVSTLRLSFYSTDLNTHYEYTLLEAFPTQISPINVSWDENNSYATMTVNFSYSGIRVAGATEGNPSTDDARGNGLLQFINNVGRKSQLIKQNNLPKTIQDAIDRFTRVKKIF
jgi:hypothetical protein